MVNVQLKVQAEWTERRNLGFEGPVRSVLTTVARLNPDPRPRARRKLMLEANPDWAVFDTQGTPEGLQLLKEDGGYGHRPLPLLSSLQNENLADS